MASNPFDQFDSSANPFDHFDSRQQPVKKGPLWGEAGGGSIAPGMEDVKQAGKNAAGGVIGTAKSFVGGMPKFMDPTGGLISGMQDKAADYVKGKADVLAGTLGANPESVKIGEMGGTAAQLAGAGGAALKAVPMVAGAAVDKLAEYVGSKIAPHLDSTTVKDALYASEHQNIKVNLHQLTENDLVQRVGDWLEKFGSNAQNSRKAAYNEWLVKEIDPESKAKALTQDVWKDLRNKNGKVIENAWGKGSIEPDKEKLAAIFDNVTTHGDDVSIRSVRSFIDQLNSKVGGIDGKIDAEAAHHIYGQIASEIATAPPKAKEALLKLQDSLLDSVGKSLPPEELDKFHKARVAYAKLKTLEPLVAKAENRMLSPQGILQRYTTGEDMQTRLLTGKMGSTGEGITPGSKFTRGPRTSGTPEGELAKGIASGSLAETAKKAAAIIPGQAYSRLGPKIARAALEAAKPPGYVPTPVTKAPGYVPTPTPKAPGYVPTPTPKGNIFKEGYKEQGTKTTVKGKDYTLNAATVPSSAASKAGVFAKDIDKPVHMIGLRDKEGKLVSSLGAQKNADGSVTVVGVETSEANRNQGLAKSMYARLNKDYKIKRDNAQKEDGKGLWESFRKAGLLDENGDLPKGAL
jgi:hypothetical protein